MKYKRPEWDDYFIEVMNSISKRATCDRGRSGAVIARGGQILSTGYVGAPKGLPHCDDVGHLMKKVVHEDGSESLHCMRTVHAEENAICHAAKLGIRIDGATIYVRMTPCRKCVGMIINSGIKRVVCEKRYHQAGEGERMLKKAGVEIIYFSKEVVEYSNQK